MKHLHTARFSIVLLAVGLVLSLSACDDSNPVDAEDPVELEVKTVEDLPADPLVSTGQGRPSGTGYYTFFSLRDGEIVLSYDAESRADSASTAWDIALQGTTIRVNGGTSGPGNGAAYVAEAAFEEVAEVNLNQLQPDSKSALAIPQGSGNGWYNYSGPPNHVISPIPGRTIVVRTADDDGYAKIRIVSYYEGAPSDPAESDADSRHYTFDYVYQPDGTSFE
jgi:hypothetical protein